EAGQLSISPEQVALAPLVHDAVELMQPLARGRGVAIRPPVIAGGSGYAIADAQRLKQVLINLVSNAVKYNRESGEVQIAVRAVGDERIRVEVTDGGDGLAAEEVARLFVPFERLGADSAGRPGP